MGAVADEAAACNPRAEFGKWRREGQGALPRRKLRALTLPGSLSRLGAQSAIHGLLLAAIEC
jgi:hypothetical protein